MAAAAAAALVLATTLGCIRPPPPGSGARGGAQADGEAPAPATSRSPEAVEAEVRRLRELGPTHVPYDRGPRVIWDEEAEARLTRTLLPVLREEGLPAATRALLWVLVGADGRVGDTVVQTSSHNEAFDRAAAEVASELRFHPAVANGRAVAAWVIREISLVSAP